MQVKSLCPIRQGMILRAISAGLAALALPLVALAQTPEYQPPETAAHNVAAPTDRAVAEAFGIAESDLPLDPAYRIGVLANGMRYIIRPNATPPGQGMVYLWVNAGSLGEDPDQAGYAHFLEHMAFNGSARVPEGEMIRLLEREGLAFGPDTNASTTFDRTIYQLNLPRNDTGLLDTALMLMRETASNLTLDAAAVAREIGVIQSELRVRDTYQQRNLIDRLKFFYPGAAFAENWVGGRAETIAAATSQRLRDYYERWYRPGNTAIIVVGDFPADAVEAAVHGHFADWQGAPVEPAATAGPIDLDRQGETAVYIDPALAEQIDIARHGTWIARPDTVATRRQRLLREIGYAIINRRFQRLAREEDPPFRAANIATEEIFHEARTTTLSVYAAEGQWQRGMAAAQEEYRQALENGFSAAEVAEQVANIRASLEANAAGAATRHNRDFLTGAMTLLEDGQVPTTPQSALERFREHEPLITPEAVLAALREDLVPLDNPLIRFSGRTPPEGGADALRAAWNAGMAAPLSPRAEQVAAAFAYTDFGPPGRVVSDSVEPLLGIRTVTFANGLKLNFKRTELQADRIAVELNIDGGEMLDTRDNPLATAMTGSLLSGGLGAHTLDELVSILAGRQVGLNVSAESETFQLTGTTTPRDLELQLQLMAAAVSDPGWRSQGEEQYRRSVANFFARRDATPEAALSNALGAILSDGDPRFSLQSEEQYMALSFARLREAISDRLANGAMELAIVGDIDEERTIALVAATLGALPDREPDFRPYADNRDRHFTADRSQRILTHRGDPGQALIQMVWPTRDGEDLKETLRLELLQNVVRSALLDRLREELGQTYSPSVSAEQSRVYPGYGTFAISAAVTPSDINAAREAILNVIASLRERPIEEDALLRARAPQLEAYDNQLKTNSGWMALVDRAQTQPDRLERFQAGRSLLQSFTPADVQEVARRYLDPAARVEIVVLPQENP